MVDFENTKIKEKKDSRVYKEEKKCELDLYYM